jgi:hypothetical protein
MNSEDRCFCDLVPLYALDQLDEDNRRWVEDQVATYPDLADELSAFQEAVTAIPYSAPPIQLAANLKDRLFQRLEQTNNELEEVAPSLSGESAPALVSRLGQDQQDSPQYRTRALWFLKGILNSLFRHQQSDLPLDSAYRAVRSHQLKWRPDRVPGVEIALLHIEPIKREVVALLRAEAGVCYPTHRHAGVEEIYMLSGDLVIGENVYGAGDYIRSNRGSLHAPETRTGCIFLVRTSLSDEYLSE